MRDFFRDERRALATLVGAALLVRIVSALTMGIITHDYARYAVMARYFAAGRWEEGLDVWPRMSPLLPLLGAVFGSGIAVSVVLGALTVVPVYALARAVWDRRVATLSAGVVAFAPDMLILSAQGMTEPPFCFFFFSAVEFVRRWADRARWRDALLAGLAGGLAALTRPEGVYFVAALVGWTILRAFTLGGWGRRLAGAAAGLLVWAAVVSPYARWIHEKTGRWDVADSPFSHGLKVKLGLTKEAYKGPPDPLDGLIVDVYTEYEEFRSEKRHGFVLGRLIHYNRQIIRICGYALYPFLLLGFLQVRRRAGDWLVLLVGLGYLIPPLLMLMLSLIFSHRYLLPGVLFWSPLMVLGLIRAGAFLARWTPEPRRGVAAAAFLLAMAAAFAVKGSRPRGYDRLTPVDAGRWVKEHSAPHPVILTNEGSASYYAEGYSFVAPARFERLAGEIARSRAQWIVLAQGNVARMPGYKEGMGVYELVHVVPAAGIGEEIRIYRVPTPKE